jgi:hypothetical protein
MKTKSKKIISEKFIRATVRNLLLEAGPTVNAALANLKSNESVLNNSALDAVKASGDKLAAKATFEMLMGYPGGTTDTTNFTKKVAKFETDLIAYLNALDGGSRTTSTGANIKDSIINMIKAIGAKIRIPLTPSSERRDINLAISNATEAYGIGGLGTGEGAITDALQGLVQLLDLETLNNEYNAVAQTNTTISQNLFGRQQMDLRALFAAELSNSDFNAYVTAPLLMKPFAIFQSADGKEIELNLGNIYEKIVENLPSLKKATAPSTTPAAATTGTGVGGSGTPYTGPSSGRGSGQGEIKVSSFIDFVIPSKPVVTPNFPANKRIKTSDIIDVNKFKDIIVKNLRGDSRSIPSQQQYILEMSFDKNKTKPAEINKNFSRLGGTHRVVLRGNLGGRMKKGQYWDGSIKEIFGNAFNDSMPPDLDSKDPKLGGLKRFRIYVTVDAGYYDANMYSPTIPNPTTPVNESKKILIKGKDILNIISPLRLKK